jgi:hypothetical protein
MMGEPRLTVAQREELGDCRLVLDAAAHNVRAAQRGEEAVQAIDNAISGAEQALVTLRRLREQLGG